MVNAIKLDNGIKRVNWNKTVHGAKRIHGPCRVGNDYCSTQCFDLSVAGKLIKYYKHFVPSNVNIRFRFCL